MSMSPLEVKMNAQEQRQYNLELNFAELGMKMTAKIDDLATRLQDMNDDTRETFKLLVTYDEAFERQMDERFNQVDERFKQVDERFKQVDKRFEKLERQVDARFKSLQGAIDFRFNQIDERFKQVDERFKHMDKRFEKLEEQMNTRFEKVEIRFDRMETFLAQILERLPG